jgi:SAM-dependent methyltransferase
MAAPVQKVRNVVRGLLQRYGPISAKRSLWNHEFTQGRWACLEGTEVDAVFTYLERYAKHGSILDLGCGPGSTGLKLNPAAYSHYTGVDISDVAIEKAIQATAASGRTDKNRYQQSDIFSYVPTGQYDVLLFSDSLYYVPHQRIAGMLERYSAFLSRDGVFIARMFDITGKHHAIIDVIQEHFEIVENHLHDSQVGIIVFKPMTT